VKTYVILLAEAEGYSHVHFHIVPRMREFTDEQRGPNVFIFLSDDESAWIPPEEMDRIALAVRREMVDRV
jgi:diadenosine tetraphosphate (Ap4A) HIT family hydrolase